MQTSPTLRALVFYAAAIQIPRGHVIRAYSVAEPALNWLGQPKPGTFEVPRWCVAFDETTGIWYHGTDGTLSNGSIPEVFEGEMDNLRFDNLGHPQWSANVHVAEEARGRCVSCLVGIRLWTSGTNSGSVAIPVTTTTLLLQL